MKSALLEWTVKNVSVSSKCCYFDEHSNLLVNLDWDRISLFSYNILGYWLFWLARDSG